MPSFTFVSTANAFVLRGARPVFVDIRPDTLNLDERLLESRRSRRAPRRSSSSTTPASACEMDAIMAIAARHGLVVDRGRGPGADVAVPRAGRSAASGTWRRFSFHETKNVICGEGGALLINDPALRRARRDHLGEGHEPQPVLPRRGRQVHVDGRRLVVSARASSTAAFLWAQLEEAEQHHRRRLRVWHRYHEAFERARGARAAAAAGRARTTASTTRTCSTCCCRLPAHRDERPRRPRTRAACNAVFHYVPLHSSPAGQRYRPRAGLDARSPTTAARG